MLSVYVGPSKPTPYSLIVLPRVWGEFRLVVTMHDSDVREKAMIFSKYQLYISYLSDVF